MFTRRFTYLILLTALLAACATKPAPAPTEIPPAEAPPMVSTIPVLPTVDVRPTPESPAASNAWSQYRDARYGIGVAYPCWWVMYPMPSEGNGATLSLRSFDDTFFRANSVKGQWKGGIAPEGVFAVDFVVFEGVDPAKSNAEAYPIDPSMTSIVSSEDKLVGQNQATVIQLKDLVNGDAPLFTVILFRLAPDRLLGFVTQQQEGLDSADLQGILSSLSLSLAQPITIPTDTPHPPLIPAACLSQ